MNTPGNPGPGPRSDDLTRVRTGRGGFVRGTLRKGLNMSALAARVARVATVLPAAARSSAVRGTDHSARLAWIGCGGSRTRPLVLNWSSTRPTRIR